MPWATSTRPSLSLGILSAIVRSRGFACSQLYPNIFLSALIGCNGYEYITNTPALFGIAEHLFAVSVFGTKELRSEEYLSAFIQREQHPAGTLENLGQGIFDLRDRIIPELLDVYTDELLQRNADVVGFTCTFNQVMPSVALAKRLKQANPGIHILMGGPCAHGEMGICYSRIFKDYVDAVFLGEADLLLPEYLLALSQGESTVGLTGIAADGHQGGEADLFDNLDDLPTPDFSEYFDFREQLSNEGFPLAAFHSLPFEGSRGCWWGEKHHCTFCGLNNRGMRYRRKSVQKVVGELTSLAEKHAVTSFMAADNILDYRAYGDLLPALSTIPADLKLFFEIKANIRRVDVEKLSAAGVTWVQPGIESFSDHVLKLMRKGTTALQNIQALKWLNEFGIEISYNLLIGFPGETDADYLEIESYIKRLYHLPSPGPEANVVQVQRFAPFHFDRERQGIGKIRGDSYYDFLVPNAVASSDEFAYFFDHDLPADSPLQKHQASLNSILREWVDNERRFYLYLGPGKLDLVTVTPASKESKSLSRVASAILVLCDEQISEASLTHCLCSSGLGPPETVGETISELEHEGLVVRARGNVLGLAPFSRPQSYKRLENWLQTWFNIENGHTSQAPAPEPELVQLVSSRSIDESRQGRAELPEGMGHRKRDLGQSSPGG